MSQETGGPGAWVNEWHFGNEKSQAVLKERLRVYGDHLDMEVEGKVGLKHS